MATRTGLSAFATLLLLLGLLAGGCGEGPQVVQGTVSGYDAATKTLVLAEETVSDSILTIDLSAAEIGEEPKPGEKVRVAYRDVSGTLRGVRVMNLSHQIH